MTYLEQIVSRDSDPNQPLIISGDLNADCDYYNNVNEKQFDSLYWIIQDDIDTTVGTTDCAYDRMISNFGVSEYGIDTTITSDLSDHFLIWMKI
jgi:endonuclease/exonuclease/phosphatase family metal-dependent hydrolase